MNFSYIENNCTDNVQIEKIAVNVINHQFSEFDLLGEGENGVVYGYEGFAIKVSEDNSRFNDPFVLSLLQDSPLVPKLYGYNRSSMICKKVNGDTLWNLGIRSFEQLRFFPDDIKKSFNKLLETCFKNFIIPHDLHLDNLMIENHNLKIVDVGGFTSVPQQYFSKAIETYKRSCRTYQYLQ